MKNKFLLFLVTIPTILITSCSFNVNFSSQNSLEESQETSHENISSISINNSTEEESLISYSLEENTPQFWIDLFTFDNVTIFLKNNLTIKRGDYYKCVDGMWYMKLQSEEEFYPGTPINVYDLYLSHYSVFTYDDLSLSYCAYGWNVDDSGYLHDVQIVIVEEKITTIYDTATLNSSEIVTEITFSDYGTTTL